MVSEQDRQDFRLDMVQAILEGTETFLFKDKAYCVECWREKEVERVIVQTRQENVFNCVCCSSLKYLKI